MQKAKMFKEPPEKTDCDGYLPRPTTLPWWKVGEDRLDDILTVKHYFGWPQLAWMDVYCFDTPRPGDCGRDRHAQPVLWRSRQRICLSESELLSSANPVSHDFNWWEFDTLGRIHRSGTTGPTGTLCAGRRRACPACELSGLQRSPGQDGDEIVEDCSMCGGTGYYWIWDKVIERLRQAWVLGVVWRVKYWKLRRRYPGLRWRGG